MNDQQCMTQPTLINLHPSKYTEVLCYYLFAVNLDRSIRSFNTLNDLFNKVCVLNKREDLNLSVFNMITGVNESKMLTKHISCECKCKFDGRKYNSNQEWNNGKCRCQDQNQKEDNTCEKDNIQNPTTCSCENIEYLTSTIDNSVVMCHEIISAADSVLENGSADGTIIVLTNFHKKLRYKMDCYILHTVFLWSYYHL